MLLHTNNLHSHEAFYSHKSQAMLAHAPGRCDLVAAPISRKAAQMAVCCSRAGSRTRVRRMASRHLRHAPEHAIARAVAQDVPPEEVAAPTDAKAAPEGTANTGVTGGLMQPAGTTPLQVTRDNFAQALPVLRQALQECAFFAFDCEMTGLFQPVSDQGAACAAVVSTRCALGSAYVGQTAAIRLCVTRRPLGKCTASARAYLLHAFPSGLAAEL